MRKIKEHRIIILLVIFQIMLVGFVISYASLLNVTQILMATGIIGLGIIIDIGVHFSLVKVKEKEKLEQQLETMRREQQYEQENLQRARKYMDDMENRRKEFYDILENLYQRCSDGSEPEAIQAAYNESFGCLSNMRIEKYCESPIVNAVLTSKCEEMKENNIAIKIATDDLTDNMGIERIDMCSVFCNLLDNAIEACRKVEDGRFINIRARVQAEYLSIVVENASEVVAVKKGRGYKTSKKNAEEHGYGTKILSMIAEKYNGKFYLNTAKGHTKAVMVLGLNKE